MKNTGASFFLGITTIVSIFSAFGASGQVAALQFCNDCLPSPPDRLVRDVNGNPLVGTNYVAQLYMGATPDALVSHTAAPARFRDASTPLPGTWQRSTRNLLGPFPGAVYLQVKVWDTAVAPTYDQAAASGTGQYGRSEVFVYNPCGNPQTPDCDKMLGFRGFTLITNPPPGILAIRENGERIDLLYHGTHTIEAAPSIRGPWTTLFSSSAPFTDPGSGTNTVRFYRTRDDPGPTYSLNAVGYYRLDLCAGFSLIANQFHHAGGNTVENILGAPPEGTRVFKFRPDAGVFNMMGYVDGAWEGDLGLTLNPGEGAFLSSPAASSKRFLGEVPSRMPVALPIPPGVSIISSPLPERGPLSLLPPGGLGFPVRNGDVIFQWSCSQRSYRFNQYLDGTWEGDDGGGAPIVEIGEAFFLIRVGGGPGTWTRDFSVGL